MNAGTEAATDLRVEDTAFDFEAVFHAHYERIARVIARVAKDPARAEELAVDVFWKLWRTRRAQGPHTRGWLYRAAVRAALDELRRQSRREKYERLFGISRRVETPEQLQAACEQQRQVRAVLAALARRQAELILLRSDGLSYQEIAHTLELNPASVGTLLSRAQEAFRKEYTKRYGNDNSTNNGANTATNNDANMAQWGDEQIAGLSPAENWRPDRGLALARLRRRERSAGARRRLVKWGTGAAGVAGLALLSFPSTRAATYQACLDACAAVWPSLAATQAMQRQADGKAAEFVLPDAEGRPVRLSDFHGKVVLLNFWATWCAPCKIEMPWFVEFQRNYRDRGFTVVAVSLDEQGWQAVRPFLADLEPNFPVVVGNDEIADLFGGVEALPTTFLIDREGVIRSRHTGLVGAEEYEAGIEELLD